MLSSNISSCALCGSTNLYEFGTLFESPLANNLFENAIESQNAEKYPLGLTECLGCGHIQLSYAIDPNMLFQTYSYKSGLSVAFRCHFEKYASHISQNYLRNPLKKDTSILDIGCNDGYLLDCFKDLGFDNTYGVDPASNLTEELKNRHNVYTEFFDLKVARKLHLCGKFDLITANNVFAHTRNLKGFADAVSYSLKENGIFVFEVQYFKKMIESNLFDMIYHEHTSYHHLKPLITSLPKYGLNVIDAELVDTHGGSIRVYCSKLNSDRSLRLQNLLDEEDELFSSIEKTKNTIYKFYSKINLLIRRLSEILDVHYSDGDLIWGYTAPAKATTWLASLPLKTRKKILFVIDDAPLKQSKFIPGTAIPIVSYQSVLHNNFPNDYHLDLVKFSESSLGIIFSWNIINSLLTNLVENSIGSGDYLVPLPQLEILQSSKN